MNYVRKLTGLSLLFILLFASSCERRSDQLGPSLTEVFGEFIVLEPLSINRENVNFAAGEAITFNAKFSTLEEWTVTITGQNSGAVKEITGFSSSLDQTNARWIGDVTMLPIFKKENCAVELTITGQSEVFRDTITITEVKTNEGVLVTDFEDGVSSDWPFFYQSGVSFFADNGIPAGQGNFFLNASGTVTWDFLIGLIEFPAQSTVGTPTFDLSSNPNQVYFNVMVYGDSERSNSFALFVFREDENGDGVWDPAAEDGWSSGEIYLTWDGWRLISIPYSEMVVSSSGDGANGNKVADPDKILSVEYLLLSDPTAGPTRGNLDYLIFTEGGPLRP